MKTRLLVQLFAIALVLVTVPAIADVLLVGSGHPYATIQGAVDAAGPYDMILVFPGDYDEDVNIRPNKEGLVIMSTEPSNYGDNTTVKAFSLLFPAAGGPDYVTIVGFKVGPGGDDNGVCIESSGDYATFAFNHLYNCNYDGIRVDNGGNYGNNIHHNLFTCGSGAGCFQSRNGVELEGNGSAGHNVHHNFFDGQWRYGINVGSDNTIVHQNEIGYVYLRGIRVNGDDGFLHHNLSCTDLQVTSNADNTKVQHNLYFDLLDQSATTELKKNEILTECPID